jgi:demethylmenaquinone methyltransferase/2-methoxy-6-polyprenyl-1,4-benzoquinol methylase
MIPFNHLGFIFNAFGSFVYPTSVRQSLCNFLVTLPKSAKVLDIGSGTGILCEFGNKCRNDLVYIAVDPAEGMMKYAKTYVETHVAMAELLPFNTDSFDALMMGESLHHLRDVDEALKECVRVLKNEGKLFIYDFELDSFMGKSICKGEKLLGEPGNFYVSQALKVKLEAYGFVVSITKHGWRYTIEAKLQK